MRPLRGLQETRVATREESGVLGFPSRRGLTPRGSLECNPEIIADGKYGSYVYEDAVASAVTEYWTTRTMEFTLTEETTIALVVMNNKAGNGASFLVDNVTLVENGESAGISVAKSPMNNIDTSSTTIDSITIPESIDVNGCRYIVTSIGDAAFSGCINLKSVIIEGNVADIGSYAFNNCFGLTNIVIPGSVADIGSYSFNGKHPKKYPFKLM